MTHSEQAQIRDRLVFISIHKPMSSSNSKGVKSLRPSGHVTLTRVGIGGTYAEKDECYQSNSGPP